MQLLNMIDAKSLDLTWQVEEFKNRCTEWDLYKKELKDISSLNVCHTKGWVIARLAYFDADMSTALNCPTMSLDQGK